MSQRHGCYGGSRRTSCTQQSRTMAEVSGGGDGVSTFRLPTIVPRAPQTVAVDDNPGITVLPMPPAAAAAQGRPGTGTTAEQHSLPAVVRQDRGRLVWNGHCTPAVNLLTGTRPVSIYRKHICRGLTITSIYDCISVISSSDQRSQTSTENGAAIRRIRMN